MIKIIFILSCIVLFFNISYGFYQSQSSIKHLLSNRKHCNNKNLSSIYRIIDDISIKSTPATIENPSNQLSLKHKLGIYGQSGLLAYGFMNFSYYSVAMIIAWYNTRAIIQKNLIALSLRDRVASTSLQVVKLLVLVWAGSQVTKAFRISLSLVLAPYADKVITWSQNKMKISSRSLAFSILASSLLASTFIIYATIILYTVFVI